MNLAEVKPNEIYRITNLDTPLSGSNRCCMVYGRQVADTLKAFKWTNYDIKEVGIPSPVTKEPLK